jgi:hypothetical protein
MERTHIHFATVAHHMRSNKWANVLLRLDLKVPVAPPRLLAPGPVRPLTASWHCLQVAMDAGHQFYLSSNQVLLCEGPLAASHVTQVALEELPLDWREALQSRAAPQPSANPRSSGAQRHRRERASAPPPPPAAPSTAPAAAAAAASAALGNLSGRRPTPWPAAVAQGQGPATSTSGPDTPASPHQTSPPGAYATSAKGASPQPAQRNTARNEPELPTQQRRPTWGTMGSGEHGGSRKAAKPAATAAPKEEDWPSLGGAK